MKTDFNYPNKDLLGPVVFRPDFNNFEKVNLNQAWSLFFTAGQEDKLLGQEIELGRFFTNLLIAIGFTGSLWAIYFNHIM
ncbi:hypothetical protein CEN45_16780 [Fischerella thermalis CCMEE 5198]|uniref:Uncharacterized protein n=5 Tax=Fischerella TaxID=1190 RepID=A0A2N6L8U5_9CYAN|nr:MULTISPECIES: hypothetical protein [Fischerella]PMB04214.1 hypothetical protein CI594_05025 [Fischerella thermalis CCMEE 5196]PMB41131.1 hypothetical protein CEN47_02745 [Fischerella thermalis CCMEE 5319]BCX06663.1 MAG: hypothetical protein KatS3mg066_0522 [Fischerella sp.]MBF1989520.1 hypothetical protein [Fischerella thermalis M58_A2018_009]MBF2061537.1 hypothetical protein [Fischerella thermalis M66_A2018_004]